MTKTITLNNGVSMPLLGYGVYELEDEKECQQCVETALELGYRLIDTAQFYKNEKAVGKAIHAAIKQSGIKREEIFITTKLWVQDNTESKALKAVELSLQNLGLDYIDLYLIHQPYNDVYGAYRALSRLYKEGRLKAIGLSNFYADRMLDMCLYNEITPQVNQLECHPLSAQFSTHKLCKECNVALQSWASFGRGRSGMFENPTLQILAKEYNKSIAQIILRWLYQRGIAAIPKSANKERMKENIAIFDFVLSEDSMSKIASLDTQTSLFHDHRDPKVLREIAETR